jgi:hypothetical protein
MSKETLTTQLEEIDSYKFLVTAEKILQRIGNGDIPDDINLPDRYEALNILLIRVSNLEDSYVKNAEEKGIEVDELSLSFLRGILSGALITSAILAEYAEAESFEEEFGDSSPTAE